MANTVTFKKPAVTPKGWAVEYDGQISQSDSDKQDSDIRLFSEVASWHNQAIEDAKKTEKA